MLKSIDPESGTTQWTFFSTPPPGTPGNPSDGATGGQMWITGTYDPDLNLVYVGTGNPTPVLNGDARPATIHGRAALSRLTRTPASWSGDSSPRPTTRTIGMRSKSLCWWTPNTM